MSEGKGTECGFVVCDVSMSASVLKNVLKSGRRARPPCCWGDVVVVEVEDEAGRECSTVLLLTFWGFWFGGGVGAGEKEENRKLEGNVPSYVAIFSYIFSFGGLVW